MKVTYVAERTNIENIKAAIANAGYDADDVNHDTEAYKNCQSVARNLPMAAVTGQLLKY